MAGNNNKGSSTCYLAGSLTRSANPRKWEIAGGAFCFRKGIMNALIAGSAPKTMTSREIAEAVGSPHDSVLKTIRRLIDEGVVFGSETPYTHPQNGQQYTEFHLTYRDTMVVASGYSAEMRAKIIDRWIALEALAAPQLPKTFAQALRLAAEQAETIEQQQAQIEAAKPAVQFVENYVAASSGSKGFREVCKLLRANEARFREFLIGEKIMYRLGGALMPHAAHMDAGRFEVKAGTAEETGHAYNTAKFTAKGVNWVAGLWTVYNLKNEVPA